MELKIIPVLMLASIPAIAGNYETTAVIGKTFTATTNYTDAIDEATQNAQQNCYSMGGQPIAVGESVDAFGVDEGGYWEVTIVIGCRIPSPSA